MKSIRVICALLAVTIGPAMLLHASASSIPNSVASGNNGTVPPTKDASTTAVPPTHNDTEEIPKSSTNITTNITKSPDITTVTPVTKPTEKPSTTTATPETTTKATTTTTTTTIAPTTTATATPTTIPTTVSTTATTPTTTATPTTAAAPTTALPAPSSSSKERHFDGLSFFGGIILATCLMAIAAFSWKFYRQCNERNYRTL